MKSETATLTNASQISAHELNGKTPAFLRVGSGKEIPGFINGHFPRRVGVTKCFFYFFNDNGDVEMKIVACRNVREAEFKLT